MTQDAHSSGDDIHRDPFGTAERVFDNWVAEHPAPDADALAALCSSHPPHADSLRRLWHHYETARRLFEEITPVEGADDLVDTVRSLARGPTRYETIRRIGHGGMCVVDEVRDSRLGRRLARKTLPLRLGERPPSVYELRRLARFVLEARIASHLRHPAIPQVYDFGLDDDQQPFLVLPLVEGVEFGEIVRRVVAGDPDWPLSRALSVLLTVCAAVSHAHGAGVLHRDLKPENVMVAAGGETHVLDWGLARPVGALEPVGDAPLLQLVDASRTADGDIVGTPVYLAPEHAAGAQPLSPAADQYQIGAMLYTLLTGRRPYDEAPTDASLGSLVERVASAPPNPLTVVAPEAPPELVAICERAMARAPADRYASVEALAADLRAYLDGHVVSAHHTGAAATLCKWIRRNRGFATGIGAALVVLFGSLSVILTLERRWSNELREANVVLREVNRESAERLAALESEFYVSLISAVQAGRTDGQRRSELRELVDRAPQRLRGLEWDWLEGELDASVARYPGNGASGLLVSPDQSTFLVTSPDPGLRLWQLEPPALLAEKTDPRDPVPLAWRPDGGAVACATRRPGGLALVAVPSLDVLWAVELEGDPKAAAFDMDGARILVCGRWANVDVVDTATGRRVTRWPLRGTGPWSIAADSRAELAAAAGWNGEIRVFDARSGELRHAFQVDSSYGTGVSFVGDGMLCILTSRGALVHFDLAAGRIVARSMMVAGDVVSAQSVDPRGALHAHARGASVCLTDTSTGSRVWTASGHDAVVTATAFVARTRSLLSNDLEGDARLWRLDAGPVHSTRTVGAVISQLALLDDGRRAVVAGLGRGVGLVDLDPRGEERWTAVPAARHNTFALSPDQAEVAVCGLGCPLHVVRLGDGSARRIELPHPPECVAWSDAGLFAGMPAAAAMAELTADGEIRAIRELPGPPNWLAAHGRHVAVGTRDGSVAVLGDDGPAWTRSFGELVNRVQFSTDGNELACALASGPVEILAVGDGATVTRLVGHQSHVNGVAETTNRWVTSSLDRSFRVWRRADGRELQRVFPDDWWLANLAMQTDGSVVVTGGEARTLHIWRTVR